MAAAVGFLLRLYGVYNLTSCFTYGEEKAVLTKNEHYNGYTVNSENDFVLDTSGKFVQYDTLQSDPKYINMASHSPPREEPSPTGSPNSLPSTSMDLEQKILQFQVFSVDKYARHKVIGENEIRIGDIDLRLPIKMWLNLRDLDERHAEYGDIMFSLSYLPTAERLTIVVVKARNLKWADNKDSGDPFVKVYLLQNGKKVNKKRTTVKRRERNPIFNEAMIFSVPASALSTVQLRITVAELMDNNRTPSLGHVIVGNNTSVLSLTHCPFFSLSRFLFSFSLFLYTNSISHTAATEIYTFFLLSGLLFSFFFFTQFSFKHGPAATEIYTFSFSLVFSFLSSNTGCILSVQISLRLL
ncbi:SYT12 [Acanthosepion pharaonis]|uniref:SYT12 n=1 Tax=Acanthosepion pharaonis TaxID=158019 RepID=A0A812CPJ2_ACAPH|nr:SYT12 [Sepia pharaonis]